MDCPTATIEWILWVDVPHPSQVKQALFQKSKGREWGWPDANKSLVGLRLPDVSQDLDVREREKCEYLSHILSDRELWRGDGCLAKTLKKSPGFKGRRRRKGPT